MSIRRPRSYTRDFKLSALKRMAESDSVQGLADELGIERGLLYRWRRALAGGGEAGLRRKGRPSALERAETALAVADAVATETPPPPDAAADCGTGAEDRRTASGAGFFSRSLAACQGGSAADRRAWRDGIYAMIQASIQQQGILGIEPLCALAGLARSGYYRHWQAHAPRQEETALRDAIQRLSLADRKLGYRPITVLLQREGWVVNHKRVERIRRSDNLLCLRKRAFRPATTDSEHGYLIYPNLAAKLVPTATNQLWVADITYVRLSEQFVYLAVVLDAFSRRVVGWALADHLRAELALDALGMALRERDVIPGGLIHHSDRGVQYACGDYVKRLAAARIQPSMSRAGCPWDNAMAESFMATLKREEVDGRGYRDLADAKALIGQFIETVYNRQRLHSALDYLAPAVFELAQRSVLPHAAALTV